MSVFQTMGQDLAKQDPVLVCDTCGHRERPAADRIAQYLAEGWPEHHGKTMRLETAKERAAAAQKARLVNEDVVAWPKGWTRTPAHKRGRSGFRVTFSRGLQDVQAELRRMNASNLRVDHAGTTARDGTPLAGSKEPKDPGVVVYWNHQGRSYAMACDRWDDRASNLRAIAKTLEAKRGIDRWGAATAEAEFKGYEALPPPSGAPTSGFALRSAHEVLGVRGGALKHEIQAAFRERAKLLHPDAGGADADRWHELVRARDELLEGSS